VHFALARPVAGRPGLYRRLAPAGVALLLTLALYLHNVQGRSLLDALPLAWTWLTLWLALSVGLELWSRYGRHFAERLIAATRPPIRSRRPGRPGPERRRTPPADGPDYLSL
jgi:hypothetical protein